MDFKKIVEEARKPMKKTAKKEQWWFDIPGAKHIYHGDWSDPEIQYKGFSLNYWDVIEGMSDVYRDEHPEDKDEKGFDAWMEEQGGPGGYLQGDLDNCAYACLGDDGLEDEEWLGIPDAYKVKEVYGQGDGDFVLYKDCLVNISDFDYYDKDYDDYFTYEHDPQGFEAYYIDKGNRGELIDQLNSAVRGMVPNNALMKEDWDGRGTQEQVLDMADREDELVWMIQDTFWHLADLGDPDILRELIENCVELEKVKPGRLKEIISEEF